MIEGKAPSSRDVILEQYLTSLLFQGLAIYNIH